MTPLDRKRRELKGRLAALDAEIAAWTGLASLGQRLEKHHSQVRLLGQRLRSVRTALAKDLDALSDAGLRAGIARLEGEIQAVHIAWDRFRSPLALRLVDLFGQSLVAADEVAWACLEPALKRRVKTTGARRAVRREPPMIFPHGATSPLVWSRGTELALDGVDATTAHRVRTITGILPLPMIGLPWFQLSNPPDVCIVAHEVGHLVEDDLALGAALERRMDDAVDGMDDEDAARWRRWRGEIFADMWAIAMLGPAFAWTLADFLAGEVAVGDTADALDDPHDVYPTVSIRMKLATTALDRLGFPDDARRVDEHWRSAFRTHPARDLEAQCAPVVETLIDGRWPELGDESLATIGDPKSRQAATRSAAADLAGRIKPSGIRDVRTFAAAGALAAMENIACFDEPTARTGFFAGLAAIVGAGVRSTTSGRAATDETAETARLLAALRE